MLTATACYVTDDYYSQKNPPVDRSGDFDFSTTQEVDLIVDYSDFDIHGPVFFRIYTENPIVNEGEYNEYVNEKIEPIFEAYTDARGIFDETVTLPAYAKVLHVVTGNFMIGLKRAMVVVSKHEARLSIGRKQTAATGIRNNAPMANGPGVQTNDISVMPCLSFNFNPDGTMGERVYKDWNTPLGTWNSATGRPDYILDSSTLPERLRFPDEVMDGLYATACNALNSGTTCKEEYRATGDLTLTQDSEITLCALGCKTCWNSSLGYYYYNSQNEPTSTMDLNIIMLYPNTQDGYRYEPVCGSQYQNNIGMHRGDIIQLLYYPNIADGDFSTVSTVFPSGTKVGFILKPNAWSSQGKAYVTKNMNAMMNIWAASTEGMSYCNEDMGEYRMANLDGEARTAKFSFTSQNGGKYAIVSVEDACDDDDYDDILLAINPADVFTELVEVEEGKSTKHGVYAFEDRWPSQADYDMNDVMLECVQEQYFSWGKVKKQVFSFTTYQNRVGDQSGLAVRFVHKVDPSKVVMKKKARGAADAVSANFTYDGEAYLLTSDITAELGTTYIFELNFPSTQTMSNLSKVQPFIYRDRGNDTRWEVHVPYEAPTSKVDRSFFHTFQDVSDINAGRWFVCKGDYPFAFYLDNIRIDYFFNNILNPNNESRPIDAFFPEFIEWSTSHGATHTDWYLRPIIR